MCIASMLHVCIQYTVCTLYSAYVCMYVCVYFYSASSSPLLLRSAPDYSNDTACVGVNTPKRHRQLRVKDLPKVPRQRLEWDSNPRPSGHKAPNVPLRHHVSQDL